MDDAQVQERIAKYRNIDYAKAAERLLVSLSHIAGKFNERPIPAVTLCSLIFDREVREHWTRETKRRRVRDAVEFARKLLAQREAASTSPLMRVSQIVGTGAGYFMSGDPTIIKWYADQRRKRGLQHLAASSQVKQSVAGKGQGKLFIMSIEAEGDDATVRAAIDAAGKIIGGSYGS